MEELISAISKYVKLEKKGKKHVGLCPFHAEKTPSFTVDKDKQLFHCFGCGMGGDVITFKKEIKRRQTEEVDNDQNAQWLAEGPSMAEEGDK